MSSPKRKRVRRTGGESVALNAWKDTPPPSIIFRIPTLIFWKGTLRQIYQYIKSEKVFLIIWVGQKSTDDPRIADRIALCNSRVVRITLTSDTVSNIKMPKSVLIWHDGSKQPASYYITPVLTLHSWYYHGFWKIVIE